MPELVRTLRFRDLLLLFIGSVIGSATASRTDSPVLFLAIILIATATAAAWASLLAGGALPRAFADSLARAPRDFGGLQWQRTWLMAALIWMRVHPKQRWPRLFQTITYH